MTHWCEKVLERHWYVTLKETEVNFKLIFKKWLGTEDITVCGSETVCVVLKLCCGKRQWAFCAGGNLGQPHVALSFNILQFKYGVLESGLFSEFFKEEGTYGQIDGLSLSQTPIPHLDLFRKGLFCVWKWHLAVFFVFGVSWSSWQKLVAVGT